MTEKCLYYLYFADNRVRVVLGSCVPRTVFSGDLVGNQKSALYNHEFYVTCMRLVITVFLIFLAARPE